MDAPVLRKVKAIFVLAAVAGVGGVVAALSGVDYEAAFGPFAGAAVSAGVAYGVKEVAPKLIAYLKTLGEEPLPVPAPPVEEEPVDEGDDGSNVGPDGEPIVTDPDAELPKD